jgi:uncharacterized protein YyaL (SSP411 family)
MKFATMKTTVVLSLTGLLAAVQWVGCGGASSDEPQTERSVHMSQRATDGLPPPGGNRLHFEKSPYLLQHAGNPVDWYAWGEEAFARARAEDKPIFLSIGYSTCHWCHVMEHESFEDAEVAALMNETFVCIKVDREERPDVDQIYMTVCQMMTGRGGWPLTLFLTPDLEPFYAATYLPKPAMMSVIPKVKETWVTERGQIRDYTARVVQSLQGIASAAPGSKLGESDLKSAYDQLSSRFDQTHGGFGDAPKFPTPHNLTFLLRYWKRTGDDRALQMVETTLERMRRGGVYDHVGFGFHRYSTDRRWFLPHFEKMLYDQAMLLMAYTEAYQATGKDAYRRTAKEIITYVLRDMTGPEGGFYSAEDADSEGEEGKFYVWSTEELRELLGEDTEFVIGVFGATENGNWTEEATGHHSGTNILYLEQPLEEVAAKRGESEEALRRRWEPIRGRMFDARGKRIHPYKDDKILTDWNGLMVAALAKASRAFDEPKYADAAARAVQFVTSRMADPKGGLYHRYRDGEASITSMVDDYAFFVWGLLELYETTFEVGFLERAIRYNGYLVEHFWDDELGGFYFTSDEGETLIVRPKEVYDGAIPSGNSVAMLNLIRLARITANTEFERRANDVGRAFNEQVARGASAFTLMMSAVDFATGPSFEIVVAGHAGRDDSRRMTAELNRRFIPSKVVLFRPEGDSKAVIEIAPYTKAQSALNGEATAYVCRNYACELPTTDVDKMLELLGER